MVLEQIKQQRNSSILMEQGELGHLCATALRQEGDKHQIFHDIAQCKERKKVCMEVDSTTCHCRACSKLTIWIRTLHPFCP